jgi:hypothetical protein
VSARYNGWKREKGRIMGTASQESMLRSVLSDPLIRLVMEADGVDPRALEAMLMATASRIERHRQPQGVDHRDRCLFREPTPRRRMEAAAQALARRVGIQGFTGEANG